MISDLQLLWGLHLYDILGIAKSSRDLSDAKIRETLREHKQKVLKVKELDLSCLPMSSIVEEISLFKQLEVLNLSHCDLKENIGALGSLKSLKEVNFSANKLDDLEVIAHALNIESLDSIDLSKNAFSTLPEVFMQKLDATQKSLPLHINLSGNIWLEDDDFLESLAAKKNWVVQVGDRFF
jgi:Leucine-rich repeat (LRR) protein